MKLCALAGETRAQSATARVATAQERRMLKNVEKGKKKINGEREKKSGKQTSQNKFHCVIASVLRELLGLVFFKIRDMLGRECSFQCPLLRSYFGVLD